MRTLFALIFAAIAALCALFMVLSSESSSTVPLHIEPPNDAGVYGLNAEAGVLGTTLARSAVGVAASTASAGVSSVTFVFKDSVTLAIVSNVEVYSHAKGAVGMMGISAVDGVLRLPVCDVIGNDLYARRVGYGVEKIWSSGTSALADRVMTVNLYPSRSIRGSLVVPKNDTIPPGLFVLAWPEDEPAPVGYTFSELATHPRYLMTQCDVNGAFIVDDARQGIGYTLVAGGDGWASAGYKRNVTCDLLRVDISVKRLYAAAYQLVGEFGPIDLNRDFVGRGYGSLRLSAEYPDATAISWSAPQVALNLGLELPIDDCRRINGCRMDLFVCAPRIDGEAYADLGVARLSLDIPGYSPLEASLACERVGTAMSRKAFTLVRHSAGFGKLSVDCGSISSTCVIAAQGKRSHLVLVDVATGRELAFESGQLDMNRRTFTWSGIPSGVYRAWFAFGWQQEPIELMERDGEESVRVTAGACVAVQMLVQDFSEIRMEPRMGGREYQGSMRVSLTPNGEREGRVQVIEINGPPYSLGLVRHGAYVLSIVYPKTPDQKMREAGVPITVLASDTLVQAIEL